MTRPAGLQLHDYQLLARDFLRHPSGTPGKGRKPRPKGTTNSPKGAGMAWLRRTLAESPDGLCRDWPYGTLKGGYGQVIFQGRTTSAHRAMLVLITGENPRGMLALHSCDRPACCAPWHLRWGTQKENVADAFNRNRRSNALNYSKRTCTECGLVSNPGAVGRHQKYTGHEGVMSDVQ